MANNRLYLVYRPTGLAVALGKRMAEGYCGVPDDIKASLERLFEESEFVDIGASLNDFAVAAEIGGVGSPYANEDTPFLMDTPENMEVIDTKWIEEHKKEDS